MKFVFSRRKAAYQLSKACSFQQDTLLFIVAFFYMHGEHKLDFYIHYICYTALIEALSLFLGFCHMFQQSLQNQTKNCLKGRCGNLLLLSGLNEGMAKCEKAWQKAMGNVPKEFLFWSFFYFNCTLLVTFRSLQSKVPRISPLNRNESICPAHQHSKSYFKFFVFVFVFVFVLVFVSVSASEDSFRTLRSLCLSSSVLVLPLDVTTPRDSYAWN